MQAIIENGICVGIANISPGITILGETISLPEGFGVGDLYADGVWTKGVVVTPVDPTEWFIDIGPFFDRFGAAKMAVLTSADAGVKAILMDVQIRKWIDLKRADVVSSLAYIGTKVPAVDATLQTTILDTPVNADENRALRKLYFS